MTEVYPEQLFVHVHPHSLDQASQQLKDMLSSNPFTYSLVTTRAHRSIHV